MSHESLGRRSRRIESLATTNAAQSTQNLTAFPGSDSAILNGRSKAVCNQLQTAPACRERSANAESISPRPLFRLNSCRPIVAFGIVGACIAFTGCHSSSNKQANHDVQAILNRVQAAEASGDLSSAVELLNQLPQTPDTAAIYQATYRKADLQQRLGRLTDAAATYADLLRHRPTDAEARRQQAQILAGCGLHYQTRQLARQNLSLNDITFEEMTWLAKPGSGLWNRIRLQRLHHLNANDSLPIHGLISHAILARDYAGAQQLLQLPQNINQRLAVLRHQYCSPPAQRPEKQLKEIPNHPEVWLFWAQKAAFHNNHRLERQALVNAVLLDPFVPQAIHALAECTKISHPAASNQLLHLWQQLQLLEDSVSRVVRKNSDTQSIKIICEVLNAIGRIPEATQWARLALQQDRQTSWARRQIRNSQHLTKDKAWQHPINLLVAQLEPPIDFSEYVRLIESPQITGDDLPKTISFQEVAARAGLKFRYDNGNRSGQVGLRMHEWTGGGAGVLDVDGDLYPDFYLTQGGSLSNNMLSDQVFRNIRGEAFQAVSTEAGIFETGFGQGIAIGDANDDGFDDALVANVGCNQLLLNQGDGTFSKSVAVFDNIWTTSVAIADLDQDGYADIYEANYLKGNDVFQKQCNDNGLQRICGPLDFDAEPDRIWLSAADGTFHDASSLIAETARTGRTMGVLVGRFGDSSGNEVFVANDETANRLFRFRQGKAEEIALMSGVAFDALGQAQGSMGIAGADVDGNGRPDLFVTNYYAESNTLYSQIQQSSWIDRSTTAGLTEPSLSRLGFGTQFADFDLDGDSDLVVANGHLDNFVHRNHPWKMAPQLFVNNGSGHFTEQTFSSGYFASKQLGRSLVTLDWNKDNRPDFAVTSLDEPFQLLQNTTTCTSRTVTLILVGTKSGRSVVGTHAELTFGKQRLHRWLTSGDGYQCSNERSLHFAMPEKTRNAEIIVHWPDGHADAIHIAEPSGRIFVIQGRATAFRAPEQAPQGQPEHLNP